MQLKTYLFFLFTSLSWQSLAANVASQGSFEMGSLQDALSVCCERYVPRSCVDWQKVAGQADSGVRTIFTRTLMPVTVYCDQDTDKGGWTVFQRRVDGSVDFYRNWTEYERGFGELRGEFWLGLRFIHELTSFTEMELRVDMERFDGKNGVATYSGFNITGASDNYRLLLDRFTGGNAGDSLLYHRNFQFSTYDNDHDRMRHFSGNCALECGGAWWYDACYKSNLNGEHKNRGVKSRYGGLNWFTFNQVQRRFIRHTEMKFRPM